MNLFTIILGVLIANLATASFIFLLMRTRKTNRWDGQSLIAVSIFCVITFFAAYLAA